MVFKDYRHKVENIQWHEGMPLAPQHFQLNDFRYQSLLSFHLNMFTPFYWGIRDLKIDSLALAKGVLRVDSLVCVMPDGFLIQYSQNEGLPPLEISLKDSHFQNNEAMKVYICLPKLSPNEPSSAGTSPRFISTAGDLVQDENGAFSDPIRIPRLFPNLYLVVGQPPSNKFISMPIIEVKKSLDGFASTEYIPPLLTVEKDHLIYSKMEEVATTLHNKVNYSLQRYNPLRDQDSQAETSKILHQLIQAVTPFESKALCTNLHPFKMYENLIDLASSISILQTNITKSPSFTKYTHTNIQQCFWELFEFVENVLQSIYEKIQVYTFQKQDGYFGLEIPLWWANKALSVGVNVNKTSSYGETYEWIENAVIGTESHIQSIVDKRVLGAVRRIIPPGEKTIINAPQDVVLMEIVLSADFISKGEVLYIFNPSDTRERRPLDLYHYVPIENK